MSRGASIPVIIAMSLMCSFDGHNTAATGQYDDITAGSKVVSSPRPRITAPPIPSLSPLTSLTTPKTKNTNKQSGTTTDARPKPTSIVFYPRPTIQGPQNAAQRQQQKSQFTRTTQQQSDTKLSQNQQQSRFPFSQAPANSQYFYQRQQSVRPVAATSARTTLPTASRPTLKFTPPSAKTTPTPPSRPMSKPASKPTSRLPSGSSTTFTRQTAPIAAQKQTPTLTQRSPVLPAPPLPKLPTTTALPQRPVAQVTTKRPTAPPTISRRFSSQKPDQVSTSRPIQASSSSGVLQSPDIYVINGRQLKQYKVYEQIDNDIEQEPVNFIPANFFLNSFHARIGPTQPLDEDLQVQSRFGNQRSQEPAGLQSPTSIALGSGGLGFVKLPNGNVYLGSGSLGYISGLQRSLDVVQARTRTGAPEPDATHFGHGSLSDSFYYGSD